MSGARFVGTDEELSSLSMALATGVALVAYATILLLAPADQVPGTTRLPRAAGPETTGPASPAAAQGTRARSAR
jgi:hypothetical protein